VGEEVGFNDEMQHRVTLTKGFYMQKTEVTVGQWRNFVHTTTFTTEAETNGGAYVLTEKKYKKRPGKYWDNPDFSQTDRHPVTCVSWNDVQAFVNWLNQMEDNVYRLPTEAEWEYACRAGTETPFSFGRCLSADRANFDCNFPLPGCEAESSDLRKTAPVASFVPNNWGLYDMHGNVWEWCQDWWGLYPSGPEVDPKGPLSGSRWRPTRICRGGSWLFGARRCRSAYRYRNPPGDSDDNLGFRLVMNSYFPVFSERR
jgi:formylglycine-generating enzyme required for sulfatase activity